VYAPDAKVFVADSDNLKRNPGVIVGGVYYCFLKLRNILGEQAGRGLTAVDGRCILQLN
jgi:hypothetical protein